MEDPDCFYHYDDEGNLIFREFKQLQETGVRFDRKRMEKERGIRCLATGTGWLYEWSSNGMLKKVIRPDGRPVEFRYDALGRRTAKQYFGTVTRWVWDGNVPIHEWSYKVTDMQPDEEENTASKEPTEDITTWVFEAGTFVPTAKIQDGKQYSIVSDYLGTPIQMYDEQGDKTWDCTLDIYGKVLTFNGRSLNDCPFRFLGQYEDEETGLYYNRFRYYSSESGSFLSQDPIKFEGKNPTLYGYVSDSNSFIDYYGLAIVDTEFIWISENGEMTAAGTNPRDRVNRNTTGINEGLSAPNRHTSTMHAEIEAITTIKTQGASGGTGVLIVKGKNICPYCKGDVKNLARQMDLDSLKIIDADGTEYLFDKKGLNTIKNGGMSYKQAKQNAINANKH